MLVRCIVNIGRQYGCFKGYKLLDDKGDIKNFRLYCNICINLEKLYSISVRRY